VEPSVSTGRNRLKGDAAASKRAPAIVKPTLETSPGYVVVERNLWVKEMRLRRPADFRRVWSDGRSWAHPLFILWGMPNTLGITRVGITASRKVGNAVTRNRARRLLRESARHLYRETTTGWDIVLVARSALPGALQPQVESVLRSMLNRAGLLAADDSSVQQGV
jgi:ribonuclease P protein component